MMYINVFPICIIYCYICIVYLYVLNINYKFTIHYIYKQTIDFIIHIFNTFLWTACGRTPCRKLA